MPYPGRKVLRYRYSLRHAGKPCGSFAGKACADYSKEGQMKQEKSKKNNSQVLKLREAILNWYPFQDGKRALLLGCSIEPLHNLLKQHFDAVDMASDEDCQSNHFTDTRETGYDCIVVVDLMERCENALDQLNRLYTLLADKGVLLLAFRNRFGLKYLCGGEDEFEEAPFTTIQPVGEGPRLYARREMEDMLCKVGFAKPRCYFLMPDADFVQAVYTEDYLPNDSIRDRVFPFDLNNSPLVAWEGDLYDDVVREGALPYVANVYLAECWKSEALVSEKQVIYAALSTDRGEEHGFSTVLYSDGTAEKRALSPAGRKALEQLYNNMDALKSRGILTVEHTLTDRGIRMPLVQEEGLLNYLRRQLSDNSYEFLAVFEQIYHDVLQSSPLAEELPENLTELWGAEVDKLKPVLRTAWIDMIPYNAFWANGRIRYYDQEFAVQDCPAKYVLFRALRYTWLHIPETEKVLPLELVKERFGLTELWNGFQQREDRFVAENRNWEALRDIHDHAWPDRTAIEKRLEALDPSFLLRKVHAVQLELLKEFDRVCRENGLKHMAIHGTLLGAVRHHGFIPWDDDVDVAMPREDYDRLLAIGKTCFNSGFFLQTPRNNYGCFYGGYSKLRRDGTAALEPQNCRNCCHQGIWIDILPLDYVPENKKKRQHLQNRLSIMQRIIYAKAYELPQYVPQDVPGDRVSIYYLLSKCTRRRDLQRRIDALCRNQAPSTQRGILACYYGKRENKNIWSAAAVEKTVEMPFEDILMPVPVGWEEVLCTRYGEDYMMLPPPEKRYRHSKTLFDVGQGNGDRNG